MQEGWISADQMRAELAAANVSITDSQIERWRRFGLLPRPKQIGKGRGRGSYAMVPPESTAQALEIKRLFAIREKRDWVGWQLWMRGFVVDDRYWRPALENAQTTLLDVRGEARKFQRRAEQKNYDPDFIKTTALKALNNSQFGKSLAAYVSKVSPELIETLIGFGMEIVQGKFSGFSHGDGIKTPDANRPDKKELGEELKAVITVLGANAAEKHKPGGTGLNFRDVIEDRLKEISKSFGKIRRDRPIIEPSAETRLALVQAMEMGIALYRVAFPFFGRSALGLGVFNRIAAIPAVATQAIILLGWVELWKISKELLSQAEIENLNALASQMGKKINALTIK